MLHIDAPKNLEDLCGILNNLKIEAEIKKEKINVILELSAVMVNRVEMEAEISNNLKV